jgi:uncharacterized membrane protein
MTEARRSHRATVAGVLIGIGMGGFVDGIVLHQIAQWHHMLSNVIPPHTMETMRVNMTWDGLFHALTWVITLVGILQLRRAAYARAPIPSLRAFTGQLILGGGSSTSWKGSSTTRSSGFTTCGKSRITPCTTSRFSLSGVCCSSCSGGC